jgi:hypothetical protein
MAKDYLTVGDVLTAFHETREALKRAEALLEKVSELGVRKPAALGVMAESTFKLRDHLNEDLAALEKAFAEAPRPR